MCSAAEAVIVTRTPGTDDDQAGSVSCAPLVSDEGCYLEDLQRVAHRDCEIPRVPPRFRL